MEELWQVLREEKKRGKTAPERQQKIIGEKKKKRQDIG